MISPVRSLRNVLTISDNVLVMIKENLAINRNSQKVCQETAVRRFDLRQLEFPALEIHDT